MKTKSTTTRFLDISSPTEKAGGQIIVLLALLIPVAVLLVAGAVTLWSRTVSAKEAQNTVDAAALAGAQEMKGSTATNFNRVPDAVELIVKQSKQIYGADSALDKFRFSRIANDGALEGRLGNALFRLRRGTYWADPEKSDAFVFTSLENEFRDNKLYYGMPPALIANAVELQIDLDVATFLPKILGLDVLKVSKSARSVIDINSLEFDGGIIAVPACEMLLNTDPGDKEKYYTEKFDGKKQCGRELVAGVANALGPQNYNELKGGIIRSETYRRPPLYQNSGSPDLCVPASGKNGTYLNCKAALGIRANLAIPARFTGGASKSASAADILGFLDSSASSRKVKLGSLISPVENTNIYKDPVNSQKLSEKLAGLINGSSRKFLNTFFTGGIPLLSKRTANFPYLRTNPNELDISWPPGDEDHTMTMASMGASNWTNPLCHDDRIPANDTNKAKALRQNIYLVSSESSDYCDFNSVFAREEQDTDPPTAKTKPRIVGVVPAWAIDFRFQQLTDPVANDPNPVKIPLGNAIQNFVQNVEEFISEDRDWRECRRCRKKEEQCERKPDGPGCPAPKCPDEDCGPKPPPPPAVEPANDWQAQCISFPSNSFYSWLSDDPSAHYDEIKDVLNYIGYTAKKCLPEKEPGCFGDGCWSVKEQAVNYGCAGLEARLECTGESLTSLKAPKDMTPALVD